MPREVQDPDGIRWSCIQAYSGVDGGIADASMAKIDGKDLFRVVCTPSGASRTVELELPASWEEDYSDEDLLQEIGRRRTG